MVTKKTTEPEAEGAVQEPAKVAAPYVPKFMRRLPEQMPADEILALQKHGFITIILPKTRDPMGDMPKAVMTEDGLRYIYRGVAMAVPITVAETLERATTRGVKMVPNPVFDREFADVNDIPTFVPKMVPEETFEKRFQLTYRAPKDHEIGLALLRHPTESAELKSYDPDAHARYLAAWPAERERLRKEKATKTAGAHSRV